MTLIEVMRTNRQHRRIREKSDPMDARQAALTVAAGHSTVAPRQSDGLVESLPILLAERTSAVKARTAAMNQIHALLVTTEDEVRACYRRYDGEKLVAILARIRPAAGSGPAQVAQVARRSLKRLATRHQDLRAKIAGVDDQLEHIVRRLNPALRIGTKAQFAALCGVAPIPASSGHTNRHRLSRGGDRRANHTLHRIALIRMRHHEPRTEAYVNRGRAENLSVRDIIRGLKPHVANEMFALLTHPPTDPLTGPLPRQQRQALGITLTAAALALGVPYQQLRRLKISTSTDADLVERCQQWLEAARPESRTAPSRHQ
jgi:hypothetical protein